jgi:hypothetical protein
LNKNILVAFVFAALLLFGCTSTEVKKIESSPTPVATLAATTTATAATSVATQTPTPEVKTVKVAEVGETLGNDHLKITLNSVGFMETIPNDNEFLVQKAKDGNTFAVVDVTIENVDKDATSISSLLQFKTKDADGYNYEMATMATISLDQQVDGKLQPGEKVRGKVAFEVPKTANGLQLVFDFGLVDLAQAKFNLGQP